MLDRILAFLAMLLLVAFLSVVVVFVKEIDLTVVIVLGLLIGIFDFWTTLRAKNNGPAQDKT
jgi:hypothetical protein